MIRVQKEDFDVGAEIAGLTAGRRDVGGVASFIGVVRERARATRACARSRSNIIRA